MRRTCTVGTLRGIIHHPIHHPSTRSFSPHHLPRHSQSRSVLPPPLLEWQPLSPGGHRLLGHVVQVRAKQLRALDVVPAVELLVDGVRGVGGAAHGEQEDVLARGLLEGDGHGDAVRQWSARLGS